MDKIWLNEYPEGIAPEITMPDYQSIAGMFLQSVQDYQNVPMICNMGKTLTYKQVEKLTADVAAYFIQELKLQKGDRIAIMMPNCLQYIVVLYAAFRAGLIVVNVNPLYTKRELEYQLNDSGANTIVVLANVAKTVAEAMPECRGVKNIIITELGDLLDFPKGLAVNYLLKYIIKPYPRYCLPNAIPFKQVVSQGKKLQLEDVPVQLEDVAFLQYTGGTTGVAKGAMLTHKNIIANMEQGMTWINRTLTPGKEIVITALPLYHIFSLLANCMIFTRKGAFNLLITNPRDIRGFVKTLQKYPFTVITGVNTLFNALLHNRDFAKLDFSHLRLTMGGGMAVQYSVAQSWKKVTGRPLLEAYGLTETSPAVAINPFDKQDYTGSVGLPLPSTEVKIIDDEGVEQDISQVGELCIRGPQVMKGYWNMPDETEKALDSDGWLRTGDMAKIDARGYIYLVDRKKDMVNVSGFNVYPNEIEDVVMQHPDVKEAAVVGVPDSDTGEAIKLFVVREHKSLNEEKLREFCVQHLTGYKRPKYIAFRDELPKTPVGKILRRELRGN
jgi:long-chain acyl-CoA synthetase